MWLAATTIFALALAAQPKASRLAGVWVLDGANKQTGPVSMELVVNGSSVRMIQLWTVEAGHRVAVYDFVVEPGHTGKRSAQEVASATVFRANCAHDTSSLSTTAPASVADTLKAPPRRPRPG
jgi:hypothetical protein